MDRVLGVDLDNTIICYEDVFWRVAGEAGFLSTERPQSKAEIASHFRSQGRPDSWTRLQGLVYGPEMSRASPYPGVLQFWTRAKQLGWRMAIVSHKTQRSALPPHHDLHGSAREWLARHGLGEERVFFEPNLEAKIARLTALGCDLFIDDLLKVFEHPLFPTSTETWLFRNEPAPCGDGIRGFWEWSEAQEWLEVRSTQNP